MASDNNCVLSTALWNLLLTASAFWPTSDVISDTVSRYVPNIRKEEYMRSVTCKKYEYWRPTTDDQPTTDRPQGLFTHFGKISNGHNSATRQPIHFMFGSRVGFSGTADRTAPFPVGSNSRRRPAAILETSNSHISAMHYLIHCMYVRRPYFALGL